MRILLTGAAGFTGLFFKIAAESAGHSILPLQANLLDRSAVSQEVLRLQPDAVVHLAAISFVGHSQDAEFYDVNVVGTLNLLAGLVNLSIKPSKVLLASTGNVYGNCDVSPIPEDHFPSPVNHYAMSKLAMEMLSRTYLGTLPVIFCRPFNYTGPGQMPSFLIPKMVCHFAQRASHIELGNLHVEREFNDVRMVCNAYLALLKNGVNGEVYNVCTGQAYSLQKIIGLLSEITGHKINVKVNLNFVRPNEVHRLCGNPSKLLEVAGPLEKFELLDTLNLMLKQY